MYENWMINLMVVLTTAALVALVVLVHYEGLALISARLVQVHAPRRRKVLLGVYGVVVLHLLEIALFGTATWVLLTFAPLAGSLGGNGVTALLDCLYLSASAYTTVGYGDIVPVGAIRLVTSMESLIGLILITWSASFLYLEMEQYWHHKWLGE